MFTSKKTCPLHPQVYLGKRYEKVRLTTDSNVKQYKTIVRYHCRVCRAAEAMDALKRIQASKVRKL